ncbi:NADH dehydrogenase [Lactococcus hodotermopsidis]|uniref:NADH:ubiquinone reductase (non-electrogenic) n=1 Tax=Pseudolactococcus hodotermopsidis TaxID=2709157 RepID=A0A6A0BEQ8_9LACT|nr:NAD(P)/FAD-dependent oxidoreductase [Lactococcus hodotermopsidis]GFH43183.1 NADH dehydrogenase [Lactococcus hodotermopsidis]
MSKKKIVVVGAGFAGIKATKTLSKKLKNEVEITLIDKHSYHTMMTQLHEVAAGRVPFTNAQYDLHKLFAHRKNVQILTDEVIGLDKKAKKITTKASGTLDFDYVIVAIGGEPNDFGVLGVKENAFTLWSMADALKIKRHLEATVEKASLEHDDKKRQAMLNFVVAGSGFTGIEMVGELIDWRAVVARDYKLDESDITLNVVEMMPTILNTLDRPDADKVAKYLAKKNVNLLLNQAITEVKSDHIKIKDGADIPTYTLIWTTGVQGNTQAQGYGLAETERGHRLTANAYMEAQGFEGKGIYVAGDVSGFIEEATGRPTPQIVEAAEQTAHTAAENIIADIKGGDKHQFVGKYQGTMVSVGSKWGVASLMGKLHLSGFFAMAVKHLIYVLYTLQIGSLWYFFTYLKNEFFHTPDNRNLFRGHTSRLANVLWSVPLRIFYGFVWLTEASSKWVGDGKLLKPSTWFGKGSWFTDDLHFPFAWLKETAKVAANGAADATAAASGAAETAAPVADATAAASGATDAVTTAATSGAAEATKSVAEFGLSYSYGHEPMAVLDKVPNWLEPIFKLMIPNKEVALFMQKFMSVVEVALALALIVGAFTWLAAASTAALTVMFSLSGMFYWVNVWFIFVAIALMNGSGRAFGLDKWLQPWLQKHFFKWWYGKSKSLYK